MHVNERRYGVILVILPRGRCDVANIDYLNAGEPCMHESMCVCVFSEFYLANFKKIVAKIM